MTRTNEGRAIRAVTDSRKVRQRSLVLLLVVAALGLIGWLRMRERSQELVEHSQTREPSRRATAASNSREPRRLAAAGKASVSGQVESRSGAPIANAQVCVSPLPQRLRGLGSKRPDCTRTDADGRYRLEGLWPVQSFVLASAAEHRPGVWKQTNARGRTIDTVMLAPDAELRNIDFVLDGGGVRLSGVVADLGGGEIAGALVSANAERNVYASGRSRTIATVSDEQGRFELWVEPGVNSIWATSENYATTMARSVAPSERVELVLTPESVLVGRVVHAETGEPVPDLSVEALGGGSLEATRSDAEGRFRIAGLAPGSYDVVAQSEGFRGEAETQVHLGLGQTSPPIEIRVHPLAWVEGQIVVAGTDEACPDGRVTLRHVDEAVRASANSDAEGYVLLAALLPGEYELAVACEGMIANRELPNLTIGSEPIVGQVWSVTEGLAIRGEVIDSEGQAVGDDTLVGVRMLPSPDRAPSGPATWRVHVEHDGKFELAGLQPGSYELRLWSKRPASETPTLVELEAGNDRNDIRLELLPSGTIRGRVIDERGVPQQGIGVAVGPLGKPNETGTMTDDEGKFVLAHVRTGEVRVVATASERWNDAPLRKPGSHDDDAQGERVEVVAGQTNELELVVENRTGVIHGIVVDQDGGPIDDAFIQVERMSDSATGPARGLPSMRQWGVGGQPTLTELDGSFSVDGLSDGNYIVRAYREGGGETVAESVAVGSRIELRIESTGAIAGVVQLADGGTPKRFSVAVRDAAQSLAFTDSFFQTDGRWSLHELPAGRYEVTAETPSGIAVTKVELGPGRSVEGVELTLEAKLDVRGRLIDIDTGEPVPGMFVHVSRRGAGLTLVRLSEAGKQVSDGEGRFEVDDVPNGLVHVTVMPRSLGPTHGYDRFTLTMELPTEPAIQQLGDIRLVRSRLGPDETPGELGFELRQDQPNTPLEQLRPVVALIRPSGPAASIGLSVGDEIELVDGKSVTGQDRDRWTALTTAPAGTTLELGLAGGKTVSLTLGAAR